VVDPIAVTQGLRASEGRPFHGRNGGLRRILLEWRGIRIYSYSVMLYLGLTFGLVAGDYAAHLAALPSARALVVMILLTVPAFLGARLLFVAIHWSVYRREPRRIWRRSEGGAAVLGGLVLAVAVSPALLSAVELPFGAFWDAATFAMLIGLIFGRLGCVLHGCCGGRPSTGPIALELPDHRGVWRRRIPTQLLEAGWVFILLIAAVGLWKHSPFPGALFLAVVAAYGGGRFALQGAREERDRLGMLDVQQVICAGLVALPLIGLLMLWLYQDPRL
jgi:phosphatidylglycerol:prolipoprotein diacylglycerol transferase